MAASPITIVREIAGGLESFFFPSLCRACGAELDGGGGRLLCPACRAAMQEPLPPDWRASCRLATDAVSSYARLPYDGPAGEAVRLLKFGGKRRMAPLLASCVAPLAGEVCAAHRLDTLVPVPLHPRRRRERGFNQAEEIGRLVAAAAGLAFRRRGLARKKYTRPQVELSGEARRANVRGAFGAREAFTGRSVLLVDDVITTGATVSECARVLREAGAAAVVALAAAGASLTEPVP
jgi:ComF family protein